MTRHLQGFAGIDDAIAAARRLALAEHATVFVQGCRIRGYAVRRGPDDDLRRAAKVTPTGLVLYWAPSLEGYVSIPDD